MTELNDQIDKSCCADSLVVPLNQHQRFHQRRLSHHEPLQFSEFISRPLRERRGSAVLFVSLPDAEHLKGVVGANANNRGHAHGQEHTTQRAMLDSNLDKPPSNRPVVFSKKKLSINSAPSSPSLNIPYPSEDNPTSNTVSDSNDVLYSKFPRSPLAICSTTKNSSVAPNASMTQSTNDITSSCNFPKGSAYRRTHLLKSTVSNSATTSITGLQRSDFSICSVPCSPFSVDSPVSSTLNCLMSSEELSASCPASMIRSSIAGAVEHRKYSRSCLGDICDCTTNFNYKNEKNMKSCEKSESLKEDNLSRTSSGRTSSTASLRGRLCIDQAQTDVTANNFYNSAPTTQQVGSSLQSVFVDDTGAAPALSPVNMLSSRDVIVDSDRQSSYRAQDTVTQQKHECISLQNPRMRSGTTSDLTSTERNRRRHHRRASIHNVMTSMFTFQTPYQQQTSPVKAQSNISSYQPIEYYDYKRDSNYGSSDTMTTAPPSNSYFSAKHRVSTAPVLRRASLPYDDIAIFMDDEKGTIHNSINNRLSSGFSDAARRSVDLTSSYSELSLRSAPVGRKNNDDAYSTSSPLQDRKYSGSAENLMRPTSSKQPQHCGETVPLCQKNDTTLSYMDEDIPCEDVASQASLFGLEYV